MYTFIQILLEQIIPTNLRGKKTESIVSAITKRHPVTFYYTGPRTPERDRVKPGTRIRAEIVAMGLSKKGNPIVRAFVDEPSTSKTGFSKNNWRTFIINRMSNITVLNDETFDDKRPGYKEGDESTAGPMAVTYVTSDWTTTPEPQPTQVPEPQVTTPEPEIEPETEPEIEPETEPEIEPEKVDIDTELPQPKIDDKPDPTPEIEKIDFAKDIFTQLQTKVKDTNGKKTIGKQDYIDSVTDLYKKKEREWIKKQKEIGKNLKPGTGTRKRFEYTSNLELSNLLKSNNIKVSDNIEQPLQESIDRIKALMLLVK
jgi:hypothetical protein